MLGVGAGRRRRDAAVARALCGACRRQPPPWDFLAAAYLYLPPLVGVVRALKFGRAEHLGAALAEPLAARCLPWASGLDVVTPVPLAWTRLLARGYNQAEEVARPLAGRLGLPWRRLLRRHPRPRQALLSREQRRRNQQGSFVARGGLRRGMRVLLVDDVMTTGATLAAAAATLRRAGAASVIAAVVARTPDASWDEPLR
jgi:ComF family protein